MINSVASLGSLVVLQESVVLLGLHDLLPVDVLGVAELVVLQDGHAARPDLGEGGEAQGLQGGVHYVEGTEVLGEVAAADHLEVPEGREGGEPRVLGLDVDEAGHLGEGAEHLQLAGVHRGVARPEGEVLVDLLEPVEAGVEDGEAALQDGAVLEALDVADVDRAGELADLSHSSRRGPSVHNSPRPIFVCGLSS